MRSASRDRGAQNKRRGGTSDFGCRHCEKARNSSKKPKITLKNIKLEQSTTIKRTFKTKIKKASCIGLRASVRAMSN